MNARVLLINRQSRPRRHGRGNHRRQGHVLVVMGCLWGVACGPAPSIPAGPASPKATPLAVETVHAPDGAAVAPTPPEVSPAPTLTATLVAAPGQAALQALVRRRDWAAAAALLRSLELDGVAADYLGARVALETENLAEAELRLRALSSQVELEPFVAADLRRAVARGGRVKDLDPKARMRVDAADWLLAAERLLGEGRLEEAGVVLREAEKKARGTGQDAVRLHALRAEWALGRGHPYRSYVDWRWLARHAPEAPEGRSAVERLAEHFPNHRFTEAEWKARLDALAERGQPLLVSLELGRGKKSLGSARAAHLLGWAYYRARDYAPAAEWLERAFRDGSPSATADAYYAGQALSRLGRLDEAIARYQWVLERSPKGVHARLSAFRIAREHALAGRWKEAALAYTDFVDEHPGNELIETALRERAVARYAARDLERAAFEFKRVRYLRPRSSLAPLYQELEALSLLGTPRAAEAIPLLEELVQKRPLTFEGIAARQRLEALARSPAPLTAPPADGPAVPLPPLVSEFEALGLFEEAEKLLTAAEPGLAASFGDERFRTECAAHGQLFAGRRQLLVGTSAAARNGFQDDPAAAPGWVWRCLYPEPFDPWIRAGASEFAVPRSFVYAIMRQESGFRPWATSTAAAHGLMQVIPPTALEIARALGDLRDGETAVSFEDPSRNVRYGIYYLGTLLRAFGGHPALAAAGYNAGPAAAGLWFAKGQQLPLEMFVAQIPFDETRTYVMRVLSNLAAYQLVDPELGRIDIPLALR